VFHTAIAIFSEARSSVTTSFDLEVKDKRIAELKDQLLDFQKKKSEVRCFGIPSSLICYVCHFWRV
jgi:hypothetical protein